MAVAKAKQRAEWQPFRGQAPSLQVSSAPPYRQEGLTLLHYTDWISVCMMVLWVEMVLAFA